MAICHSSRTTAPFTVADVGASVGEGVGAVVGAGVEATIRVVGVVEARAAAGGNGPGVGRSGVDVGDTEAGG